MNKVGRQIESDTTAAEMGGTHDRLPKHVDFQSQIYLREVGRTSFLNPHNSLSDLAKRVISKEVGKKIK